MINKDCNNNDLIRQIESEEDSKVGFIELFYDLVFVFAITQISHTLLKHLDLTGLAQAGFLTLAVWWVWIYTTWATNWLNPQKNPVRLMLVSSMFACLIMGMAIPHAFTDHALRFACAYAFMQVSRSIFTTCAFGRRQPNRMRNLLRISTWLSVSGVFWVLGGLSNNPERYYLFGIALFIEYMGPIMGFWIPLIGRSYAQGLGHFRFTHG